MQRQGGGGQDDSRDKQKAVPKQHSLNSRNSTFSYLCLPRAWLYLVLCAFRSMVLIESPFCAEGCANCYMIYRWVRWLSMPSDTYSLVRWNDKASNNNIDHSKIGYVFLNLSKSPSMPSRKVFSCEMPVSFDAILIIYCSKRHSAVSMIFNFIIPSIFLT